DRERIAQCARRLRMTSAAGQNLRRIALASLAPRLKRAGPGIDADLRATARLASRLAAAVSRNADERAARVGALRNALAHLDPTQVLGRGYSIVRGADGHVRSSSDGLVPGDPLDITFSRGGAAVSVKEPR
ncbi:MAG: exodeoxyribonuclease VII large subunit, partial [Usitatibacter sp.]